MKYVKNQLACNSRIHFMVRVPVFGHHAEISEGYFTFLSSVLFFE